MIAEDVQTERGSNRKNDGTNVEGLRGRKGLKDGD